MEDRQGDRHSQKAAEPRPGGAQDAGCPQAPRVSSNPPWMSSHWGNQAVMGRALWAGESCSPHSSPLSPRVSEDTAPRKWRQGQSLG